MCRIGIARHIISGRRPPPNRATRPVLNRCAGQMGRMGIAARRTEGSQKTLHVPYICFHPPPERLPPHHPFFLRLLANWPPRRIESRFGEGSSLQGDGEGTDGGVAAFRATGGPKYRERAAFSGSLQSYGRRCQYDTFVRHINSGATGSCLKDGACSKRRGLVYEAGPFLRDGVLAQRRGLV